MSNRLPVGRARIAVLASLAVTSALVAAGCGGSGSSSSGSSGSAATGAKGKNVIMILGVSGNEGYDSVACGAKMVAKQAGIDLSVTAPSQLSGAAERPVLEAAIAKHPDAIMIAPIDANAMEAPIQQAVSQGIKVILFDADLNNHKGISTWVGVDNRVGGALAGKTMSGLIGGKGKVMVVNLDRGTTTTDAREDGFVAQIKQDPGIQYIGSQYNTSDATKAASQVASVITAHPDLAGVYGTAESEVEGAATGIQNSGKAGKIKLVGFDASPPEVAAVKRGSIQALVAQDVRDEGTTAMHATIDVLNGKPVKPRYLVGFYAITQKNVDTQASKDHYYVSSCPA